MNELGKRANTTAMDQRQHDQLHSRLAEFARRHLGATPIELRARTLRGGLTAGAVMHVVAQSGPSGEKRHRHEFVIKRLPRTDAREAEVYRSLPPDIAVDLAPRMLAVEQHDPEFVDLYLEAIVRTQRWPWHDVTFAAAVLRRLAALHALEHDPLLEQARAGWDYEAELRDRAHEVLRRVERFASESRDPVARSSLPALRRVVSSLDALRSHLVDAGPFPPAVLHGDVHPGNVLVRRHAGQSEPVFLDWGRARVGSPLEDVSSWLQSLGFWEPAVKRKHDTLLRTYLDARGLHGHPSRAIRDVYWLAAASNCLAGALAYHIEVTGLEQPGSHARDAALAAAYDYLRMVRRADACWASLASTDGSSPRRRSG